MHKSILVSALLCGAVLVSGGVQASTFSDAAPAAAKSGNSAEPQVTVVRRTKETVEEYRLRDQLYMIKVMRNNGQSYYLVDTDGDGRLDKRRNELDSKQQIPSWLASR